MAIIFTEDLTRNQGKLANADIIQGSWRTVGTKSDLNALTGSISDRQTIEDGQLFWAKDEDTFYRYKIVQVGFSQTLTFEEFSFGGGSTPDGTISGSQQISDLGFITNDQTSSFVLVDNSSSFFQSMSFDDSTNLLSIEGGNTIDLSPLTGSGGGSGTGIFALTGSIYSTTNNIQVTGSFEVGSGLFKLTEYTTLPSVEAGAIAYSGSNFYFGIGDV